MCFSFAMQKSEILFNRYMIINLSKPHPMSHFIKLIIRGKLDHWTWTGYSFQEPNNSYLLKVSLFRKKIFKPRILPKNERMNSFLLVCDVSLFGFWKNPRLEKKGRYFKKVNCRYLLRSQCWQNHLMIWT